VKWWDISRVNIPTFLKPGHSSYLPAYEDGTGCSETSDYKIQTPGNYPEESIQLLLIISLETAGKNSSKSDVWLTVHRNSVWIRKTN
jgi:hypothetical protein